MFIYECNIDAMEETKKTYDELKDKYDELNADYVAKYFALKDKYKKDQAELREQYLFDRLMVEKHLKAEKYSLKTEKRDQKNQLELRRIRFARRRMGRHFMPSRAIYRWLSNALASWKSHFRTTSLDYSLYRARLCCGRSSSYHRT